MYVPFSNQPETARLWIYTAAKPLSESEMAHIREKTVQFCSQWSSHNIDVRSSFEIQENQFLILAADTIEHDVSGCGIDKSMHHIQTLETDLVISLTDRSLVVYISPTGLKTVKFTDLRLLIANGEITGETLFFNTLLHQKGDLRTDFCQPAAQGWIKRYLAKEVIR